MHHVVATRPVCCSSRTECQNELHIRGPSAAKKCKCLNSNANFKPNGRLEILQCDWSEFDFALEFDPILSKAQSSLFHPPQQPKQ